MLKIEQVVLVEGRYDKIRLSSVLDALILETEGFGIFKDKEKQRLIKRLGQERGILILTDSDAAGFRIRAFLGGLLPSEQVYHAYIPDRYGKEKRKEHPSAEGKLGVEGMDSATLRAAIEQAGLTTTHSDKIARAEITTADLYEWGLTGQEDSAAKRRAVLRYFDLPERLSTTAFRRIAQDFIGKDRLSHALADHFPPPRTKDPV